MKKILSILMKIIGWFIVAWAIIDFLMYWVPVILEIVGFNVYPMSLYPLIGINDGPRVLMEFRIMWGLLLGGIISGLGYYLDDNFKPDDNT